MPDRPRPTPAKRTDRGAREQRLAQALRDNLQRRKEQRREKSAARQPLGAPPPGSCDDDKKTAG